LHSPSEAQSSRFKGKNGLPPLAKALSPYYTRVLPLAKHGGELYLRPKARLALELGQYGVRDGWYF